MKALLWKSCVRRQLRKRGRMRTCGVTMTAIIQIPVVRESRRSQLWRSFARLAGPQHAYKPVHQLYYGLHVQGKEVVRSARVGTRELTCDIILRSRVNSVAHSRLITIRTCNMACIGVKSANSGGRRKVNMTVRKRVRWTRRMHTSANVCVVRHRTTCETPMLNEIVRSSERDRAETWRWVWIPPTLGL